MTDKDAALKRLYARLFEAIEKERFLKTNTSDGALRTGYNAAIADVLDIIEQSSDEMWYEEES